MAKPARNLNPAEEHYEDSIPQFGVIDGGGEGGGPSSRGALSSVPGGSEQESERLRDAEQPKRHLSLVRDRDDVKKAEKNPDNGFWEGGAFDKQTKGAYIARLGQNKSLLKKLGFGGGIITLLAVAFISLIPLKLEMLVKTATQSAAAIPEHAIENRLEYLTKYYIAQRIVGAANGQDIDVGKGSIAGGMFNAWKAANYERQLGFTIESDRINPNERAFKWTIRSIDGQPLASGTGNTADDVVRQIDNKKEMKAFIKKEIKAKTKWHQFYKRYAMRKTLMRKYGVSRWSWLPESTQEKLDTYAKKKREMGRQLRKNMLQNTVGRILPKTSLYMECLTGGGDACKELKADVQSNSEIRAQNDSTDCAGEATCQATVDSNNEGYQTAAEQQNSTVDNVTETVDTFDVDAGDSKFLNKLLSKQVIGSFVGGIGALDTVMRAVNGIENGALNQVAFDRNSTAYIGYSSEILAINDQIKDGRDMTIEQVGAVMEVIGDFGSSPAWQVESGVIDPATAAKSTYKRNCPTDEKGETTTLPKGQTVCTDRKVINEKNPFEGESWWEGLANFASGYMKSIGQIMNLITGAIGAITEAIHLDDLLQKITELPPVRKGITFILNLVFGTPVTGLETGADAGDNVLAGVKSSYFALGQTGQDTGSKGDGGGLGIGGAIIDKQQTSVLRQQIAAEQKEQDASRGLLARLFDTESTNSVVSQIALRTPTSLSDVAALPRLLASAVTQVGGTSTSAAGAVNDAFGFDFDYAYSDQELSADPTKYNEETCKTYDSEREASYKKVDAYPIMVYTKTDPCALEKVVAASGMSAFIDGAPDYFDIANMNGTVGGTGSEFTISSFNVLGASHTGGAYEARMNKSITAIQNKGASIVGFQEFQRSQRGYFKQQMPSWELYPSDVKSGTGENAIGWDASKFTKRDGGMMPKLQYFGGGYALDAPWVLLEDKLTKQQFYVLNTHDPAHRENAQKRYENALQHVVFTNTLKASGYPVFFTGDFNSGYELRDTGNNTWQDKAENITYCIITKAGFLNDSYDVLTGRGEKCPNPGNDNSIDHVYVSEGVKVKNYTKVQGGPGGSGPSGADHDAQFVDILIPGSGAEALGALKVDKVLTFVVENKSLDQMKQSMKYTFNLAEKYAYATNYKAVARPSLPNYIAIATGSDQGISSNDLPGEGLAFNGKTVFKQAIDKGKTAKIYAESMPSNCYAKNKGWYVPRHNPWTYVQNESDLCDKFDVDMSSFNSDVAAGTLPNSGLVVPNNCHNSHDDKEPGCKLSDADDWFKDKMEKIMNGPDWKSGKLLVILTADEADKDDASQQVLTVALNKSLEGASLVSKCNLNHYSLSKLYSDIAGAEPLGQAGSAEDLAACFKLREDTGSGGWSWPVDEKWWETNKIDFLNAHPTYSGTFTSPYAKGIAADISSPAAGAPVYSMLDGTVVETNLCGEGDGMIISSKLSAGTLTIAYGHGTNPQFKVGDKVKSGQKILSLGGIGCKTTGPHLHIDMSLEGKHICPQDVFIAIGRGLDPDLRQLTKEGVSPCSRAEYRGLPGV